MEDEEESGAQLQEPAKEEISSAQTEQDIAGATAEDSPNDQKEAPPTAEPGRMNGCPKDSTEPAKDNKTEERPKSLTLSSAEPLSLTDVEVPESSVRILSVQKQKLTHRVQHPLSPTPTNLMAAGSFESDDSLSDGTSTNNTYTTAADASRRANQESIAEPRKQVQMDLKVPIVGYEVMEERSKFTVFKVRVLNGTTEESWFVYRRYTDFARLNKKLTHMFPGMRFGLPPKRWFGDNFDAEFLEDRMLGLQAYVSNIVGNEQTCNCQPVRDFFCLDEPPGTYDTIEETRTRCESLEEQLYNLQQALREKESEVELLRAELSMVRAQQSALVKSLSVSELTSSLTVSVNKQLGQAESGELSPGTSPTQIESIRNEAEYGIPDPVGSGDHIEAATETFDSRHDSKVI